VALAVNNKFLISALLCGTAELLLVIG